MEGRLRQEQSSLDSEIVTAPGRARLINFLGLHLEHVEISLWTAIAYEGAGNAM